MTLISNLTGIAGKRVRNMRGSRHPLGLGHAQPQSCVCLDNREPLWLARPMCSDWGRGGVLGTGTGAAELLGSQLMPLPVGGTRVWCLHH